jgi:hypothetical protein
MNGKPRIVCRSSEPFKWGKYYGVFDVVETKPTFRVAKISSTLKIRRYYLAMPYMQYYYMTQWVCEGLLGHKANER